MLMLVYSPFPDLASARAAAGALLSEKLVACCNLLPGVESHYIWQGTPTMEAEVLLIAKTVAEKADSARALLMHHHPYECPAILSFSAEANPAFAAWVAASTGD